MFKHFAKKVYSANIRIILAPHSTHYLPMFLSAERLSVLAHTELISAQFWLLGCLAVWLVLFILQLDMLVIFYTLSYTLYFLLDSWNRVRI